MKTRKLLHQLFYMDEGNIHDTNLLNRMLIASLSSVIGISIINVLAFPTNPIALSLFFLILLIHIVCFTIMRHGFVKVASWLFSFTLWLALSGKICFFGSQSMPGFVAYLIVIFIGGMLLKYQGSIIYSILSIATVVFLVYAEITGISPANFLNQTVSEWPLIANYVSSLLIGSLITTVATFIYGAIKTIGFDRVELQNIHANLQQQSQQLAEANQQLKLEIAERKQAEEGLRESESRFRALVESSFEGIAVSIDSIIIEANKSLAKMFGYELIDILGMTPFDLVTAESARFITTNANADTEVPYQVTGIRKDGSTFPLELLEKNIFYKEQRARVTGFRDITERTQAEEALRQAQKMESLGILAGGVAHDFNNLLAAILGQTSVALARLPPESPSRIHLDKAIQAIERASALTQQLLAYSGRGHFDIRPIHLNTLFREKSHLFEVVVPKHIQLHLELHEPLPLIEADSVQMQQVITNLILNGVEAIGDHTGTISVITGVETLSDTTNTAVWFPRDVTLPSGQYITVAVHDTGTGMDAQTITRIFDPFFTTKATGRGLGLAAVLGIVRGHHGKLQVKSKPGNGASFKLIFPVYADTIPTADKTSHLSTAKSECGLILVIDDEQAVRDAITDILELEGYRVITATDGQNGIDLFAKRWADIDLTILDLSMPGISGEETFHRLKEIDANAKIILSSGYSEQEATHQLNDEELTGFLQKPYRLELLVEKVQAYL